MRNKILLLAALVVLYSWAVYSLPELKSPAESNSPESGDPGRIANAQSI